MVDVGTEDGSCISARMNPTTPAGLFTQKAEAPSWKQRWTCSDEDELLKEKGSTRRRQEERQGSTGGEVMRGGA